MLPTALLTLALTLAVSAAPSPKLTAHAANDQYPIVRTLGSADPATGAPTTSVEGVSTDKHGNLYCVTKSSFVSLTGGQTLYSGSGSQTQNLASSRWKQDGSFLLGDAGDHRVLRSCPSTPASPLTVAWESKAWLQPNDLTSSNCGSDWYFSGMDYAAGTGDLWYSLRGGPLTKAPVNVGRTNGIEVTADGKWLLLTAATNQKTGETITISDAKIWKFPLKNGVPDVQGGKPAFEIYGIKGAKEAGVDPDGMRVDVKGNVYATLNAWGRVLVFNVATPEKYQVVELPSVAFPTNLEMGGWDGKTLVVVGKCKDDPKFKGYFACVDKMAVPYPGRAWSALNKKL